jgi:hypothetical protein
MNSEAIVNSASALWLAIGRTILYALQRCLRAPQDRETLRALGSEAGQAMMEYILTVIVCVAPLLIFWSILLQVMRKYILGVYFFASLPIP